MRKLKLSEDTIAASIASLLTIIESGDVRSSMLNTINQAIDEWEKVIGKKFRT